MDLADREPFRIEARVDAATHKFLDEVVELSREPLIREAIAMMALRDMAWAFVDRMGVLSFELADHLEMIAVALREHPSFGEEPQPAGAE